MVANEMLQSPKAMADMVSSLSDYDPGVVKEAVDLFLNSRESLNRSDNLVLLLESACQNVQFRREMQSRGANIPQREAKRIHYKISDELRQRWGNKRYVVIEPGYPPEDIAALREANPNRIREHPTQRGAWVYKRWTQGEIILKQCKDGRGPRLLQEQLAKIDSSEWPQRVDEWTRQHAERWTTPMDLDSNKGDFDWTRARK